jgi:AraC-like DNA-binding protein
MAAMTRATRRIIVLHLLRHGITPAEIASELGVSKDTVRRDSADAPQDARQDAEDAQHTMRPVARPVASGLLLPETPQTARDLEVLCAAYSARPEDAARFAIHQAARHVRAWQAAHNEGRRPA